MSPSILCVISARGGSQGVPGKNLRPMFGVPLIVRAIQTLQGSACVSEVFISTDSRQIAETAEKAGASVLFMRPPELATANAGKFQVWQHALCSCEELLDQRYEIYLDLDCTNPLMETRDVDAAVSLFLAEQEKRGIDAVFTVAPARRNPYFNLVEPNVEGFLKMSKDSGQSVLARQRAPTVFEHVAGVYVLSTKYLRTAKHLLDGRVLGYEVSEDKAFDVDSELDFSIIEFLLSRRSKPCDPCEW